MHASKFRVFRFDFFFLSLSSHILYKTYKNFAFALNLVRRITLFREEHQVCYIVHQ